MSGASFTFNFLKQTTLIVQKKNLNKPYPLKQFSNHFADIAEKANPAVVTVLTEKNVDLTNILLRASLAIV